jgi:hypothetical protein
MDAVLAHLSAAHAQAAFVRVRRRCGRPLLLPTLRERGAHLRLAARVTWQVEAEALSDVSEKHGVPSVPFFLFFKARATQITPR